MGLILWSLVGVAIIHTMVFFVLSRLFVPFLGFKKEPIAEEIPKGLEEEIKQLKKASSSATDFARRAAVLIHDRYESRWFSTLFRLDIVFLRGLDRIWQREGRFLPCNSQNHLVRIMLVRSGHFRDSEIRLRHCFLNFGIHQYIHIVGNRKREGFDIDPWGLHIGIPFGSHASLFRPSVLSLDKD